jgi:hypothetical protein
MFDTKKYQPVKEIVSQDIVQLVTQYALLDELNNFSPEGTTEQVAGAHSRYGDQLMESLLLQLQPSIEYVSGKKLIPTYSYYRVYRPGHELKTHIDRPSCEISTTVSFGQNYQEQTGTYTWPMFVEGAPIILEPGDAIVYKGCDASHWREKFNAPQFSYHVQGFFHYVDANGPYTAHALDKRKYIGETDSKTLVLTTHKKYITFTK